MRDDDDDEEDWPKLSLAFESAEGMNDSSDSGLDSHCNFIAGDYHWLGQMASHSERPDDSSPLCSMPLTGRGTFTTLIDARGN